MKMMHGIALAGVALLLVACGSSSGDDAPGSQVGSTEIPQSARADSAGLVSFTNSQIDASSDSAEPIVVGDAAFPVDDTTETSL